MTARLPFGPKEFRVFGPPGCGKTTRAARDIGQAVEKHGPKSCLVSSFTKAAATEIAGRDVEVAKEQLGTLHSICYRALGRPVIAETKAAEFNELHPGFALTPVKSLQTVEDPNEAVSEVDAEADDLFGEYQVLRARMTPRDSWPMRVLGFAKAWEGFKERNEYLDFTDVIEVATRELPIAPGNPRFGFIDEAQDLNALQWRLVRKWGESMEYLVVYGDDDQAIYDFTGASAEHMIGDDIPRDQKRFLTQSHRLPSEVHRFAQEWISRALVREPKEFRPVKAGGEVARCRGSWRFPEPIVTSVEEDLEAGRRVMILASASYMLRPIMDELRNRAMAYHNPYRRSRGDWNPISRRPGSTLNRMLAFIRGAETIVGQWTVGELKSWMELVNLTGTFKRGAKGQVDEWYEEQPARVVENLELLELMGHDPWGMDPPSLDWLQAHAKKARDKQIDYLRRIIGKGGISSAEHPKIVLGTIHSVKGGEADSVYVIPDLSRAGFDVFQSKKPDPVIRLFYVAATRARESLRLVGPASTLNVGW